MKKSLILILSLTVLSILAASSCSKKESITLNDPQIFNGTLTLEVKYNHQIQYSVQPEGTPVTWTSSDPMVAYALGDWVAANVTGTAVITGTTPGGASCSFTVNVTPMTVKAFNIPSSLEMYVGETKDLEVTDIEPKEADAGSIIWEYSEPDVASHVIEGCTLHITGNNVGTTRIHGTGTGGGEGYCNIVVKERLITSFALSTYDVSMDKGGSVRIDVTNIKPEGFPASCLEWEILPAGVPFYAQWDGNTMVVTAETYASYGDVGEIYFNNKLGLEKSCVLRCEEPPVYPVAIDMGLSVKWADINLGAKTATDAGFYYQWANITPRTSFTKSDYIWNSYYDNQYTIRPEDDAATQLLGSGWRIPSDWEMYELFSYTTGRFSNVTEKTTCTWTYKNTSDGKVYGYEIKSKSTGNTVFFPARGFYEYSSDSSTGTTTFTTVDSNGSPIGTYWLNSRPSAWRSDGNYWRITSSGYNDPATYVYNGRNIRAVYDPK